jgi:hypothetical protein
VSSNADSETLLDNVLSKLRSKQSATKATTTTTTTTATATSSSQLTGSLSGSSLQFNNYKNNIGDVLDFELLRQHKQTAPTQSPAAGSCSMTSVGGKSAASVTGGQPPHHSLDSHGSSLTNSSKQDDEDDEDDEDEDDDVENDLDDEITAGHDDEMDDLVNNKRYSGHHLSTSRTTKEDLFKSYTGNFKPNHGHNKAASATGSAVGGLHSTIDELSERHVMESSGKLSTGVASSLNRPTKIGTSVNTTSTLNSGNSSSYAPLNASTTKHAGMSTSGNYTIRNSSYNTTTTTAPVSSSSSGGLFHQK